MNLEEYYSHIHRLSFVTRYSNIPRIRNESVAEHSFFVAAIILKLKDDYKFNLGIALQLAISHDITEADLTDVTHRIKRNHPRLANEIASAERRELLKYPYAVQYGAKVFMGRSIEALIVNLADVIQVEQYALAEVNLGNSHMDDILKESNMRIHQLQKEIEPNGHRRKT